MGDEAPEAAASGRGTVREAEGRGGGALVKGWVGLCGLL